MSDASAPGETGPRAVTRDMVLAAFDCGTTPMFMLRPGREIVHANRAAQALLAAGRAFSQVAGILHVQRQSDRDEISAALASVRDRGKRVVVRLTNRQGDVNHVITVTPLPGTTALLVAIAELRAPLLLAATWSREALSLPLHYAELAEGLAAGENLTEFADRTGLTIGGTRTRLKKLLKRLGVRSQSDLIAMLLRSATTLGLH